MDAKFLAQIVGLADIQLKGCLGLYLSLDCSYLCETHLDGDGRVIVDHLVRLPLAVPEKKEATSKFTMMNTQFFAESGKWSGLLQQAMRQVSWSTRKVVVSLSSQFGIIRYFTIPRIERRFLKQSVLLESKKYIPVSLDDAVYDFQAYPIGTADESDRMGVLFGITSKKNAESIGEVLQKLGLEIISLEMSACSVERLFVNINPELQVKSGNMHFDASTAYVLLPYDQFPVLYREVNLGAIEMQSTERRKIDLKSSLEFVHKQVGTAGSKVYENLNISGQNLAAWKGLIEKETSLPVRQWDPGQSLGIKNTEWGTYATVGASLRFQSPKNVILLDISGKSKAVVEQKEAVKYFMMFCGVIIGLMLVLALISGIRLIFMNTKINKEKTKVSNIAEFYGKEAEGIKAVVEKTRKKNDALSTIVVRREYLTPKLEAVADFLPESMRIHDLTYKDVAEISASKMSGRRIEMKGFVEESGAGNPIDIVRQFQDGLKKNTEFIKSYGNNIEMEFKTSTAKKEDHTFRIIGVGK